MEVLVDIFLRSLLVVAELSPLIFPSYSILLFNLVFSDTLCGFGCEYQK